MEKLRREVAECTVRQSFKMGAGLGGQTAASEY